MRGRQAFLFLAIAALGALLYMQNSKPVANSTASIMFLVSENKYCSHGAIEFVVQNTSPNILFLTNGQAAIPRILRHQGNSDIVYILQMLPESPVAPGFETIRLGAGKTININRSMPAIGMKLGEHVVIAGEYRAILEFDFDGKVEEVASDKFELLHCK